MIGGSRSDPTLSTLRRERQLSDDDFGLDAEPLEPEPPESEPLEPELFELELSGFVADDEVLEYLRRENQENQLGDLPITSFI